VLQNDLIKPKESLRCIQSDSKREGVEGNTDGRHLPWWSQEKTIKEKGS